MTRAERGSERSSPASAYSLGEFRDERLPAAMRPLRHVSMASTVRARSAQSGISLVVVLCALIVLGIAAVFAIPAYFDRPEITLHNACELLAHDVRSLQNRAALDKVGVRLVLEEDGWRALNTSGAPVGGIGEQAPIDRHFSRDGVFGGVHIESIEAGPDHAVGIDVRGLVTEHARLEIVFQGERRQLTISRGAGEVTVEAPAR